MGLTATPPTKYPRQSFTFHYHRGHKLYPVINIDWKERIWSNWLYVVFLLFLNLALPCIIFYVLREHTNLNLETLIGISSAALGISCSCDGPFRSWKLWRYREFYGPLDDDNKWHFDITNHIYALSIFVFAIPLTLASCFDPPLSRLFEMAMAMLFGTMGLLGFFTLFPIRVPFRMSSDPPHSIVKPLAYYFAEDIIAVDFRHGRAFRQAFNNRYTSSPPFRTMFFNLTVFWVFGTAVFFAAEFLVAWTTDIKYGFGLVLGITFLWLMIWTLTTILIVQRHLKYELIWWLANVDTTIPKTPAISIESPPLARMPSSTNMV